MLNTTMIRRTLCGISLIALLAPAMVAAQEARGLVLDEVVVTAQKREQSAQDVGIAITAVSGDMLASLGIDSSSEVALLTPNFNIQSATGEGNQPSFIVRGVGLNDYNTNNAGPVAIYQDEALISSPSAQTFALFDVERVEVLRGPQGTLYGRNATGGTVNFVANKPTDTLQGSAGLTVGNLGQVKVDGAISGPLSDNLSGRFAFISNDADGYADDVVTGEKYNEVGNRAIRAMLDWTPSDEVSVLTTLRWGEHDTIRPVYKHAGAFDANTFDPLTGLFTGFCSDADILGQAPQCVSALGYQDTSTDIHQGSYNRAGKLKFDTVGATVKVEWGFTDQITFTSITSYDELDKIDEEDSDSGPQDWLTINFNVESESFAQEFRFNGSTERANWIVGAFVLDEKLVQDQSVDLFRDLRPFFGFDPDNFIFFSSNFHVQDTRAWAIFGQTEFDINDRLSLVAGVRYTQEDRDFSADVTFIEPGFSIPIVDFDDSIDEDNVSGKIGLNFTPNGDLLVYGSITTGFKSGGFPGVFGFSNEEYLPYKSEQITSYEAGFKSTMADGKAQLNGAVFFYDYSDLQLFQLFTGTGITVQRLTNAADAEVVGAELELQATPVDGLYLQLSLGYLDTELKKFIPVPGLDLSGNSLAYAPELTFSGLVRYDWDTSAGSFYAQLSAAYQDDVFFDTFNAPVTTQKAYTLVGARAGYISKSDRWEASIWSNNLTDEEYKTFGLDLSGDFGLYQFVGGAPQTYGATVAVRFE